MVGARRSSRWGVALCVLTLTAAAGCRSKASKTPDPCANGGCDVTPCELGVCEDEDPFAGLTVTQHSNAAGTYDESLSASCPFAPEEIPEWETLIDDSSIPEFDQRRSRRSNMKAGNSFLQDHELHEHLLGVQGSLFECLDIAACYDAEVAATGELDFEFWLEPDGRVTAVSVTPSEQLDQPVVRACARKSVFSARFPSWNGGGMLVSYRVEISEGAM